MPLIIELLNREPAEIFPWYVIITKWFSKKRSDRIQRQQRKVLFLRTTAYML